MNRSRSTLSFAARILAALALFSLSGCHGRTDVQCGTTPVEVNGKPSGLETCSDGVTHRAAAVTCESKLPSDRICNGTSPGTCSTDAECTERPFGHCESFDGSCGCSYGCQTDADCQAVDSSGICLCGALVGECEFFAQCKTDADCAGSFCTVVHHPAAVVDVPDIACLSPSNECEIDADCGAAGFCIASFDTTGRVCPSGGFGFGR
jgi:hypothetical protein